jgi:hypothetical protein
MTDLENEVKFGSASRGRYVEDWDSETKELDVGGIDSHPSKTATNGAASLVYCVKEVKIPQRLASPRNLSCHTRRIMTSVALMSAAAVCPGLRFISRAELAVMIDVIC